MGFGKGRTANAVRSNRCAGFYCPREFFSNQTVFRPAFRSRGRRVAPVTLEMLDASFTDGTELPVYVGSAQADKKATVPPMTANFPNDVAVINIVLRFPTTANSEV